MYVLCATEHFNLWERKKSRICVYYNIVAGCGFVGLLIVYRLLCGELNLIMEYA